MEKAETERLRAIQKGVARQAKAEADLKAMLESSQSQEDKLLAARVMVNLEEEKVTNTIKAFLKQNGHTSLK